MDAVEDKFYTERPMCPVSGECPVCEAGGVVNLEARQKAYYDTYVLDGWESFYDHMLPVLHDPETLAFLHDGLCSLHASRLLDEYPGAGEWAQPTRGQSDR